MSKKQQKGGALARLAASRGAKQPWFRRASDVEIARYILAQLKQRSGAVPIACEGELYTYRRERGVWAPLSEAELEREVHALDGARIGKNGEYRANNERVTGVRKRMLAAAATESFFDDTAGLCFENGFVHVASDGVRLSPHSPRNRARSRLEYPFGSDDPPALFLEFLDQILQLLPDRETVVALFQEYVGLCLIGQGTRFHKALLLFGSGENGKSQFIEAIEGLFPPSAVSSVPLGEMNQDYKKALLVGQLVNIFSETGARSLLEPNAFKAIVAGDRISARHPYGRAFSFRPRCGHIFAANDLPVTADASHGFWRRFVPIPFAWKPEHAIPNIAQRFIPERPAMAAWFLDGAVRALARDSLVIPTSSVELLSRWKKESSSVSIFAHDRLVVTEHALTKSSDAYRAYEGFCFDEGEAALSHVKFSQQLVHLGFKKKVTNSGTYWFFGVRRESGAPPLAVVE